MSIMVWVRGLMRLIRRSNLKTSGPTDACFGLASFVNPRYLPPTSHVTRLTLHLILLASRFQAFAFDFDFLTSSFKPLHYIGSNSDRRRDVPLMMALECSGGYLRCVCSALLHGHGTLGGCVAKGLSHIDETDRKRGDCASVHVLGSTVEEGTS